MPDLSSILHQFSPIFLDGMDTVKLMNRRDAKYLIHLRELPAVLEAAQPDYQVLEIDGLRIMGYESLYFDTPDHLMYRYHHNQKLNRYKVRIRQYLDSTRFFLEIKFKDNKGKTQKKRIPVSGNEAIPEPESLAFIEHLTPFRGTDLEAKLFTRFERITLVNTERKERITIDMNLNLHNEKSKALLTHLVIVEVKSESSSQSRGFGHLLNEQRIFKKRISKYCLGTNLLFPEQKHNRFKPKLLYINKLEKIESI